MGDGGREGEVNRGQKRKKWGKNRRRVESLVDPFSFRV